MCLCWLSLYFLQHNMIPFLMFFIFFNFPKELALSRYFFKEMFCSLNANKRKRQLFLGKVYWIDQAQFEFNNKSLKKFIYVILPHWYFYWLRFQLIWWMWVRNFLLWFDLFCFLLQADFFPSMVTDDLCYFRYVRWLLPF